MKIKLKLNDGNEIPLLGLGVFKSPSGKITYETCLEALRMGYRHIDTAAVYGNEADVGRAVRDCGIARGEIFVTTKLWNSDQGHESGLKAFDLSLQRLGLDYVDLYLIHWPVEFLRHDSWRALCEIVASRRARSIGVSNFTVRHLKELGERSGVVPAVNQVEFHPFLFQRELLEYCRGRGIQLEAYSPLTKGDRLNDETVLEIAKKYGKTGAQILIRWCLQHEVVCIPKSVKTARLRENFSVFDFEISTEDMARLDSLNENYRTSWDPSGVE